MEEAVVGNEPRALPRECYAHFSQRGDRRDSSRVVNIMRAKSKGTATKAPFLASAGVSGAPLSHMPDSATRQPTAASAAESSSLSDSAIGPGGAERARGRCGLRRRVQTVTDGTNLTVSITRRDI